MLAVRETGHLALGRFVWTYLRDGQPSGLLTGYETGENGLIVEHIVAWSGHLLTMLHAGLHDAWERGYASIVLMIPRIDPRAARLELLAGRLGFAEYAGDEEADWFVRYRP